jgi:hypothetical protein
MKVHELYERVTTQQIALRELLWDVANCQFAPLLGQDKFLRSIFKVHRLASP